VKLTVIRGNAAEPHDIELVREVGNAPAPSTRPLRPGLALLRVPTFAAETASTLRQQFAALGAEKTTHVIVDLRGTAEGPLEEGLAAARLFVAQGTLGAHESRTGKSPIAARAGDGAIAMPLTLLVDAGTAGAAELFAAALNGNGRATLVGDRTAGRAAMQELVKLPDGTGLWLTTSRYLTPKDAAIHGKGLTPDVVIEAPDVEFGAAATSDPMLEKAIEHVTPKLETAA
jgi:carboxyl-terminal processing protease